MPAPASGRLRGLDLPPGDDFIAALDAAWDNGDAVLPLDPRAPRAVTDRLVAAMRLDQPVDDGVALVIATSGSTGEPKGAQLSHAALEASARATHARIGLEPNDRWLSCLPWQHIGGLQVMLRARLLGIPLTVHERFEVDAVTASPATLVSLVPTQLLRLLDAGVDLRRFRAILLGGAAASPALLDRARDAGAAVVTTYGMSETAGGCVYDGRPLDGVEVTIADDGRIRIRGPVVMTGYRLRPDLTAEVLSSDGWLTTGDLGEIAPDGRLAVKGRADDVIVSGGENVVAAEVAGVLAGHPDVVEVVVTGVLDEHWGQRVVAVLVARGERAPSLSELREFCAGRLPQAATPRGLVVVDELPRLPSGKPDRLAVLRLAQATPANSQSADPGSRS
ncbi:MAG TPA: AMP-binding protein [Mycobacteriales bacterium]|nr:AMP-binding protein [Mycobacteriales bacterium]